MSKLERFIPVIAAYPPEKFEYDPTNRQFTVGEAVVPLNDFNTFIPGVTEPIDEVAAEKLIAESTLVLGSFDRLFQMPKMYEWLKSLDSKKVAETFDQVSDTMIEAYLELSGMKRKDMHKGSHWGFGVQFYRPGHPVLTVVGDCACLGVTPHGYMFDEHAWNAGLSEYETHNIDWPAQETTLMAGAGTLAHMCSLELGE
jgi:hypothetical protein